MAAPIEKAAFRVEPGEAGTRLDAYLASHAGGLSRSRLKALIEQGRVTISAGSQDAHILHPSPSHKVAAGDLVEMLVPEPEPAAPLAQPIPLDIVHEDADLIVVDKPAGLVVHPAAGNWTGTLVNALLHHCGATLSGVAGVRRPGIVHRLDKDTSGLMVVAKNDAAHASLSTQFADHGRDGGLVREYQALVWGAPRQAAGRIEAALDRDPRDRLKNAVVRSGGRHAVTHYWTQEVLADGAASLMRLQLETGRTHQIRIHMAYIGHPLIGDPTYGTGFRSKANALPPRLRSAVDSFRRQALHAGVLGFRHPRSGEPMRFSRPPPADLSDLIGLFRERTV